MKKSFLIAGISLVAVMLAGCVNNEGAKPTKETAKVSLTAGIEETRTHFNGNAPIWSTGDAIGVHFVAGDAIVVNNQKLEGTLSNENAKATFAGEVTLDAGNYTIYGYYPHGGLATTDPTSAKIEIPSVQAPTATSFDPAADIMVMQPVEHSFNGADISHDGLRFKRAVGMVRLILNSAELNGQAISSIAFTNDAGIKLAGTGNFNLTDGGSFNGFDESAYEHVIANPVNVTANGTDEIMLCIAPTTIPAGTQLFISGKTAGFIFSAAKTLGEDIVITAGGYYTMRINSLTVSAISVPVTGITLSATSLNVAVGANSTLSVTNITPSNATDKTYNWSSDDTGIASISSTGVVTGVAAGTTTVKATANDGSGVSASCTVTVTAPAPPLDLNNVKFKRSYDSTISLISGSTYLLKTTFSTFEGEPDGEGVIFYLARTAAWNSGNPLNSFNNVPSSANFVNASSHTSTGRVLCQLSRVEIYGPDGKITNSGTLTPLSAGNCCLFMVGTRNGYVTFQTGTHTQSQTTKSTTLNFNGSTIVVPTHNVNVTVTQQ